MPLLMEQQEGQGALEYSSKKMQTLNYVRKNCTNSSSSRVKTSLYSKGCDFKKLVQSLCDYEFNNRDKNTFLIGDLNFDAPGNNNLSNYLSRLEFKQMVGRATHLDGHILDHVYVPQAKSTSVDIKHHHVYYSDHDGILVSVKKDVAT